jgi:hypothetical protein
MQTFLKNTKWATWPTRPSPPKNIQKRVSAAVHNGTETAYSVFTYFEVTVSSFLSSCNYVLPTIEQ